MEYDAAADAAAKERDRELERQCDCGGYMYYHDCCGLVCEKCGAHRGITYCRFCNWGKAPQD